MLLPWLRPYRKSLAKILPKVNLPSLSATTTTETTTEEEKRIKEK
jgi:hypothetical protein